MNFRALCIFALLITTEVLAQQSELKSQVKSLHSQTPDYFPMHIGDKWVYKLTTGFNATHWANQIVTIIDTTVIQQKRYFVFEVKVYDIYYEPGKVRYLTHYYRKADNGDVMKLSTLINQEQLYYTFQKDSLYQSYLYCGDFDLEHKWKITLIDTHSDFSIPSGAFSNCYYYSFGLFIGNIDGRLTKFLALAPDIGFILETAEGDFNFILGAYINGKLMGDTTLTSVTSIQESVQSKIPLHPILSQNYPNPFNNSTRITYSIPDFWADPIQISIFDISGHEVLSFSQIDLKRGHHEFLWNGINKQGEEVSNGIYVVRLKSGRFFRNIKINYLK